MDFHLASYAKHKNLIHDEALRDSWAKFDTVDYWRHERMYTNLLSFIRAYPNSSWLTIGDGRYGTDANFLQRNGCEALATDINDSSLVKAKKVRFINNYKIENAESLSFESNHFDFVLCKESYHHFPRPMLALYEMIRVCKKAVILIEPNDQQIINPYQSNVYSSLHWLINSSKNFIKKYLGRHAFVPEPQYESVGNFVYLLSQREVEKLALGMNLPACAFKLMNDAYIEGVEFETISSKGPLLKHLKAELQKSDLKMKRHGDKAGLLIAAIFKSLPSNECVIDLSKDGFNFQKLPRNPFAE
jgi:ubiquinone/menaquinone biosynthesis C-methylase UbiE